MSDNGDDDRCYYIIVYVLKTRTTSDETDICRNKVQSAEFC